MICRQGRNQVDMLIQLETVPLQFINQYYFVTLRISSQFTHNTEVFDPFVLANISSDYKFITQLGLSILFSV